MDSFYVPAQLAAGLLILLVAWLPLVLQRAPVSLPIICIALGGMLGWIPAVSDRVPHPISDPFLVEKLAELVVIVSLMGAGLKIDQSFAFRGWRLTWRLLALAMPLSILAFLMAGHLLLGLGSAAALLLGASLAPTDPVLASDVQITGPDTHREDEVRFALTSEAGLNDSFAFPFVHLALAVAVGGWSVATLGAWALDAVLLRLAVGALAGWAGGWLVGWVIYRQPTSTRLSRTGDGFVALGATLAIYAGTELLHGYGFLAVFIAGLMMRRAAEGHDFNDRLHGFVEELERLLMLALLLAFGAMVTGAQLLRQLGPYDLVFALVAVFVIRPLAGWLSMLGARQGKGERAVIAFFGIRGLGSVYYLAYGLSHGDFVEATRLWGAAALVILLSILLHGVSVTPVMRRLDARREATA